MLAPAPRRPDLEPAPGSTTGPGPPWSSSASARRRPARATPSARSPRGGSRCSGPGEAGAIRLRWEPRAWSRPGFLDPSPGRPAARPRVGRAGLVDGRPGSCLGLAAGAAALPGADRGRVGGLVAGDARPDACPAAAIRRASRSRRPPPTASAWPGPGSRPTGPRAGRSCCSTAWPRTGSALLGRVPPLIRPGLGRRGRSTPGPRARAAGVGPRSAPARPTTSGAWLDALAPLAGPRPTFAAWGRSMGASTALEGRRVRPPARRPDPRSPLPRPQPAVAAVLRRLRIPAGPSPP